ncbi:MAG: sulfur carrier protein ThiS adenylyltransferase ThiF [Candidatus Omnitrophota bacterium]|nr:sulfur carrier protein ThiS adenylyltransferase ThiF [Candidatus Omnitrophota bacterium]
MNRFEKELLKYLGEANFKKVRSVKVGIAGLGGLGSNCAMNLVRSGFKRFIIADLDKVDMSNLNRQFYFYDQIGRAKTAALNDNLKKINPDLKIEEYNGKVRRNNAVTIFEGCDIVVEAFDRAEDKAMIVEALLPAGKFIVSVSGIAGIGDSDGIKVRKIGKNLVVIGDMTSDVKHAPPMSPRVNIAAAKQADVVLEYVVKGELGGNDH